MDLAVWRDVSLILLLFLTLIAVLPFGALFFFAIAGMSRLRQLAKRTLPIAQQRAHQVADVTDRLGQKVAGPIIGMRAGMAQVHGIRKATFRRKGA
jgi:hypothetical protein